MSEPLTPRQEAAALIGIARNQNRPIHFRLDAAVQACEHLTHHIEQAEAAAAKWVSDHAWAPDDIVLGPHTTLDEPGLANLQRLLDIAHPQWREVFRRGRLRCCSLHGTKCEPPSELCCWGCAEAAHPEHADNSVCVLAPAGTSTPVLTTTDTHANG